MDIIKKILLYSIAIIFFIVALIVTSITSYDTPNFIYDIEALLFCIFGALIIIIAKMK